VIELSVIFMLLRQYNWLYIGCRLVVSCFSFASLLFVVLVANKAISVGFRRGVFPEIPCVGCVVIAWLTYLEVASGVGVIIKFRRYM